MVDTCDVISQGRPNASEDLRELSHENAFGISLDECLFESSRRAETDTLRIETA